MLRAGDARAPSRAGRPSRPQPLTPRSLRGSALLLPLRGDDGQLDRAGSDLALLPGVEGERHPGLADACLCRGPDRAVEQVASTELREGVTPPHRLAARPDRELDLDGGVYPGGEGG